MRGLHGLVVLLALGASLDRSAGLGRPELPAPAQTREGRQARSSSRTRPEPARPAGSVADLRLDPAWLLGLRMTESPADLARLLRRPSHTVDGDSYRLWQFNVTEGDGHDFEFTFYFSAPDGNLLSATRQFEDPVRVDALFPEAGSRTHRRASTPAEQLNVRSRLLPGNRVLLAVGVSGPGERTSQLILLRRDALARFYPWVDRELR